MSNNVNAVLAYFSIGIYSFVFKTDWICCESYFNSHNWYGNTNNNCHSAHYICKICIISHK